MIGAQDRSPVRVNLVGGLVPCRNGDAIRVRGSGDDRERVVLFTTLDKLREALAIFPALARCDELRAVAHPKALVASLGRHGYGLAIDLRIGPDGQLGWLTLDAPGEAL